MTIILRLLTKYALWIYILCGIGMIFYLRAALGARREGGQAIFSLERETAAGRVYRSSGMILLLLLIVIGVYGLSHYVEIPATSITSPVESPTPTAEAATPTRLALTPTPGESTPTAEPTATRRPRATVIAPPEVVQNTPTAVVAPPSCPHPNVSVLQPGANQVINAGIEVRGTAQKELFDRYEFKFQSRDLAGDDWHWVETFQTPVENGSLGYWQTAHLPPGNYRFMLIVIDKTGNSQECVVPVVIQH
jgi:hypothetical protein